MKTVYKAYMDVEHRAGELGLAVPDAVWILPLNFESMASTAEAAYAADYDLVVKLLRMAGLPYSLLKSADDIHSKLIQQDYESVALPLLAFTRHVLERRPEIVSQTLGIILDHFRSRPRYGPGRDQRNVRCKIAKAEGGRYVSAEYEGPIEGFGDFVEGVK